MQNLSKHQQTIMDFEHEIQRSAEDFLISPANQLAMSWLERSDQWPSRGLVVFGMPHAGKTHMGMIWCEQNKARRLMVRDLENIPGLFKDQKYFWIDDAEDFLKGREKEMFHFLNLLQEHKARILMTSTNPPRQWDITLPDLASRILAMGAAAIEQPDDILVEGLLLKFFQDRQLRPRPDVVRYLLPRLRRDYQVIEAIVAKIDELALIRQAPISISIARQALSQI